MPYTPKPNPTHLNIHTSTLPTSVHTVSTHVCGLPHIPHLYLLIPVSPTYLQPTHTYLHPLHTCTPNMPVPPYVCIYTLTQIPAPSSNTHKTIEASSPHLEATVPIKVFQGHSLPESSRTILPPSSASLDMQVPHPRLCLSCLGLLLWAFPVPFFLRTIVIECRGFPSHKSSRLDVINCTRKALFPNKATLTVSEHRRVLGGHHSPPLGRLSHSPELCSDELSMRSTLAVQVAAFQEGECLYAF